MFYIPPHVIRLLPILLLFFLSSITLSTVGRLSFVCLLRWTYIPQVDWDPCTYHSFYAVQTLPPVCHLLSSTFVFIFVEFTGRFRFRL